jgi:hypothetical protein
MRRPASLLRPYQLRLSVVIAFCLLLLASGTGVAQTYSSPQYGLPTYMTSIYYPRIYGSYEYPRPMGIVQPGGVQQSPFSTSPTIYSVYATPGSAFGPGESILSTAMTPLQTTAFVTVGVPADAELRFEGVRTGEQFGVSRRLPSSPAASTPMTFTPRGTRTAGR